ncbi:TRAP transporter large permease [Desmospora activa]|uniref:Tripartite ATP-independent transporter DctM subunit n=1 Tax=Desmospora activa DSM 45169 TaxID=1121389 RepID=A0A2T4ZCD6_9BACL|nr:TRAP transporter large permease [Desmospora activa]PTM59558.1 tripartite ATP-independent transporter DctM subunit [Desmospora activa DSM 45169]
MDVTIVAGLILLISFVVLLVIGVPISVSIGIAATLSAFVLVPWDIAVFTAAQKLTSGIDSFALLAIPFFILAGSIMNNGGIALRLINLAKLISGRLPGSLAQTTVVGNLFFGSVSGSGVAAAATIGGIMHPLQKKEGYDPALSATVNIASSPTGLLIPPSNAFIVYALVSGSASISALFMAGVIPGILMGLTVMIVTHFLFHRQNLPSHERLSWTQVGKILIQSIPSLLLIVVVIGGISFGVFTATEGAAVAVLYSLILSLIYRSIHWEHIPKILKETVVLSSIVLFLIGASSILSWVMAFTGLPSLISEGMLGMTDNPFIILLIMIMILLLVGTVLDMTPAILIFTPMFLPIANGLGVDPVHFGIILVFALCIGIMTPPVGSCLFVGCSVANVRIEQVFRPLSRMVVALVITLLLVAYIPEISLTLPRWFGFL